jgi:glutamine amidotransferase
LKVAIIKYNAGNIKSVDFALQRIGINAIVSDDIDEIKSADKIIFPGVGEASSAMKYLREKRLDTLLPTLKQPVLGICLGMQLMCAHSEEGDTNCLNIFPLNVRKFSPTILGRAGVGPKIPQIGWNNIYNLSSSLFNKVNEKEYEYFVHSYYVENGTSTIATCDYIQEFSAAIQKDNFYAVQFHPEKSGSSGEKILQNFLSL